MIKKYVSLIIVYVILQLGSVAIFASTTDVTIDCSADTYINDGQYGNSNYGTTTELVVKDGYVANYTRKSLLKFPISSINNVNQVILKVKGSNVQSAESITVNCIGINTDWDVNSITWNNSNLTESGIIAYTNVDNQSKYYEWDITSYIQTQKAAGVNDIALLLEGVNDSDRYVVFKSMESNDIPHLTIIQNTNNNTNFPIDDAYVNDGQYDSQNYGSSESLVVKDGYVSNYTRYAYLKFDISDKTLADIGRVFVTLYGDNTQTGTSQIDAYMTSSNWTEDTITWLNKPATGSYLDTIFVTDEASYDLEITEALKAALTNNQSTVSIAVRQKNDQDKSVYFNSKEASSHQPIIDYRDAYTTVFEDTFDGAIGSTMDLTKWEYRGLGPRNDAINVEDAVYLDGNGNLVIKTYTDDKGDGTKHYTGMIRTINEWKFGKYEARVEFNSTPGMWSAYWIQSPTMGNPIGDPGLAGIEIDVVEHLKNSNNSTLINLHWDGYSSSHKHKGTTYNGVAIGDGYHTFSFEWTPEKYKFLVDGNLAWVTNSPISLTEEYIILSSEVRNNSWAGTTPSGGYGDLNNSTTTMKIDYVRVSQ